MLKYGFSCGECVKKNISLSFSKQPMLGIVLLLHKRSQERHTEQQRFGVESHIFHQRLHTKLYLRESTTTWIQTLSFHSEEKSRDECHHWPHTLEESNSFNKLIHRSHRQVKTNSSTVPPCRISWGCIHLTSSLSTDQCPKNITPSVYTGTVRFYHYITTFLDLADCCLLMSALS